MLRLDPQGALEAAHARATIDVREEAAFRAGHLPGSAGLPACELAERRAELPPRDRPVLVLGASVAEALAAAAALEGMGYADVAALEAPATALAVALSSREPAARLWRPAPYLEWALGRFRALIPPGPVADVAAGAGRDAVFLALSGFEVEAFDHDAGALARASALAARHGVRLGTVVCDLVRADSPFPESRYALIACFRFLHRPLLPRLAAALRPGGVLIYETYRVGQERFGRPKSRRFLLERGELARAFPGLEVMHAEECEPADGPITARLTARRG